MINGVNFSERWPPLDIWKYNSRKGFFQLGRRESVPKFATGVGGGGEAEPGAWFDGGCHPPLQQKQGGGQYGVTAQPDPRHPAGEDEHHGKGGGREGSLIH